MTTSDQELAAPAQQPVAWLGESVGFKSFTRQKAVAERWQKGRIEVTAVYASSEPELRAEMVRLTRERDEHERMRTLYVTSAQEEHARAEAAESRVEALLAALDEEIEAYSDPRHDCHTNRAVLIALNHVRSRAALDKGAAT